MRSTILINKPEIYSGKIFYYKGLLDSPEFLVRLIEKTNIKHSDKEMISQWRIWQSSDKVSNFGFTKSIDPSKFDTSSDDIRFVYGSLISAIRLAANNYSLHNNLDLGRQSPLSISKYSETKFMGPHTDEKTGAHISGVLYLNDDYSGGELGFPNQGFSIKPEAGSMVIFPSTDPYVHDPKPAYGAERYICPVFWYK